MSRHRIEHDISACPCPWHPQPTRLNGQENRLFQALHPAGVPKTIGELLTGEQLAPHTVTQLVCRLRPKIRSEGYVIASISKDMYCLIKMASPKTTNGKVQR